MNRRHNRGFTLLELMIAMAISIIALGGWMFKTQVEMRERLGSGQGDVLVRIQGALSTYMVNNYAALVNGTAVTGVATAMAPTVAELQTIGLLDGAVSSTNLYGGNYGIQVSKVPAACTPPNCNLYGLVWLTNAINNPVTGTVDGVALGSAISKAGGDAAYSLPGSGSTLSGFGGSWTDTNPAGNVPGILAMRAGYGSSGMAAFLRRDGSLPMTGTLNMGSQRITGVMTATAGVTLCTTKGDWAQDATTGAPVYCDGTKFQPVAAGANWVATYGALPACNAASKGQIYTVMTPAAGSGPRGYSCDGAAWQPLAVADNGTLTVANSLQVGNTAVGAAGSGAATGAVAAGTVEVKLKVADNSSCAGYPEGAIAQSSVTTGLILSCQSGSWKRGFGNIIPQSQVSAANAAARNSALAGCSLSVTGSSTRSVFACWTTLGCANWIVRATATYTATINASGVATVSMTSCAETGPIPWKIVNALGNACVVTAYNAWESSESLNTSLSAIFADQLVSGTTYLGVLKATGADGSTFSAACPNTYTLPGYEPAYMTP